MSLLFCVGVGMRQLNFELHQLTQKNRDGSYATRNARSRILSQAASELHELGYRRLGAHGLKAKHVEALLSHWQRRELATGTIKNRMAHLRWWAEKVGKPGVLQKDNEAYGILRREYVTNVDKSRHLDERLERVRDEHVRMSLRLQAAFGLRREEAIKFIPVFADKDDKILLKDTWTKGGKAREIALSNDEQRAVLKAAHRLAGKGSLIPSNRNYIQQLKVYENNVAKAGFSKLHGLRHAYAQRRYAELTGWACPALGGPRRRELADDRYEIDVNMRLIISKELGHERLDVVAVYLGS